jgi:P63C domain
MSEQMPKASHIGELKIGDMVLPCAVLEDGRRVVTEEGILQAFGVSVDEMGAVSERSEVSDWLVFIGLEDQTTTGYSAELLSKVCRDFLDAREANELGTEQQDIAAKCKTLLRGLALIGITALIDTATGYQREKDEQALHTILETYLDKDLVPWVKCFPEEFWKHLFRLRRWQYSPLLVKYPKYVGNLVQEMVFDQLSWGVLDDLKGRRPAEQGLDGIGSYHLEEQIIRVITLMQVSSNWRGFESLFARAHKKRLAQEQVSF